MRKRILIVLAALAALTLGFSSCKKDKKETDVKFRIEGDSNDIKLLIGKTHQMVVTVEPKGSEIKFESANAEIASVTDKGLVTGVKAGETAIKVTVAGKTKEAKVTVKDPKAIDEATGIGKRDQDLGHFIYVPVKKEDIKKGDLELFKMIMTTAGWEFDQKTYDYDKNADIAIPFKSPAGDKEGEYKYGIPGVIYLHSLKGQDNHIKISYPFVFNTDPLGPENQEKIEKSGLVYLFKELYGFTENAKFVKLKEGNNAWVGVNSASVKGAYLLLGMYTRQLTSKDVPTQPELVGKYAFEIFILYTEPEKKSNSIQLQDIESLRDIRLATPLQVME